MHGSGTEGWLLLMAGIVLAVVAVVAIVYLVRSFLQPQTVLKRRCAAGEIDRALYLQSLEVCRKVTTHQVARRMTSVGVPQKAWVGFSCSSYPVVSRMISTPRPA